jgi:outer membrane protein TolC
MKSFLSYTAALSFALTLAFQGHAQQKLSLQEALTLGLAANPELRSSALEIQKAERQKIVARSLFLPSVTAGAQANHYFALPAFFGFGANNEDGKISYGRFGGKDQLTAFITAVQPLYNPLAFPSLQHAQLRQQQSAVAARAKQIEILSAIKETYLKVLVLNERIRLKQESISRNKRVLQDSRSLFIQGKGLRVDTLRAYTSVKNLEPDLVKLTFAAETGRLQLRTLIGIDSLKELILTDSLTIPVAETIPGEAEVYEEVKRSNPEFQVLNLQTQLEKQQVRMASAYRKPVLSLLAQYQVQTQTNNLEYQNAHYPSSSFVGLQLSVPLFTGLSTYAKVKQADISREQSDLKVIHTQEKLRALVHEAIASNKEALLRLENTAIVQETAQLSYNIILYRYKNGISPRLELTDAELSLSTAQSNYLEAVYDYLSARIQLRKLMGEKEID